MEYKSKLIERSNTLPEIEGFGVKEGEWLVCIESGVLSVGTSYQYNKNTGFLDLDLNSKNFKQSLFMKKAIYNAEVAYQKRLEEAAESKGEKFGEYTLTVLTPDGEYSQIHKSNIEALKEARKMATCGFAEYLESDDEIVLLPIKKVIVSGKDVSDLSKGV